MKHDWLSALEQGLVGRQCVICRRECDWSVALEGGGGISIAVPWRIVASGRIAFADTDDRQQFGLPAPIDGEAEANRLISGKAITRLSINEETADLSLHFGDAARLDLFNHSMAYEGWDIALTPETGGLRVIALGGGELAIFNDR